MTPIAKLMSPFRLAAMTDLLLLNEQRHWRLKLLEGPQALRWRPARELAAQLLLYLDDPAACWRLTTDWMLNTLGADRVDAGLGGYALASAGPRDYVVLAETRRPGRDMASMLGQRFGAGEQGVREVWQRRIGLAVPSVARERSMAEPLRERLLRSGAAAKMALPLRAAGPVGLICADWQHESPPWPGEVCDQLPTLAGQVIGPLLALATEAHDGTEADRAPSGPVAATPHPVLALLTPAERRVAELVAMGLSYKEVARRLGRSLSTIDHQLRSIRGKTGVASTARLVSLLNAPAGALGRAQ